MKKVFLFLTLIITVIGCTCKTESGGGTKILSTEEIKTILDRNKINEHSFIERTDALDTIRFERRFSKPLSKETALERIENFYNTIIRLVWQDKTAQVINLIQNSYAFDYAPIAALVKKHNIDGEKVNIRLYPALSQDGIMTLVITLEDTKLNETITAEYPVKRDSSSGTLHVTIDDKQVQDEYIDEICPSAPNCPKPQNALISDDKIEGYKNAIKQIIDLNNQKKANIN